MTHIYKQWEHESWGNSIEWGWGENPNNLTRRRVQGCLRRRPEVDDVLLARSAQGTVHEFRFAEVEPAGKPADLFFAIVDYIREVNSEAA